jgi:ATP-dependent Clp protease protease subunit
MALSLRNFLLRNLPSLPLDRVLLLEEPINEVVADRMVTRILQLQARDSTADIVLLVNSLGGELKPGWAIYDAMRQSACDVITVCTGNAASMAALLLAAGTRGKRVALSRSRVSLHAPSARLVCSEGSPYTTELQQVTALVYQTLAELTGQHTDKIEGDARGERALSGVQARAYGFVDHVDRFPGSALPRSSST